MIFNKQNEKQLIIPIILAGGGGESLWPISRRNLPKPFLNLIGNSSLLQNAVQQIQKIISNFTPVIIGNITYSSIIQEQLNALNMQAKLLLETQSHDTGVAVAIAAQYALTQSQNPLLLVFPIDIYIDSYPQFAKMIGHATKAAYDKKLVIFGVNPDRPSTNYGHIQKGDKFQQSTGFIVKKFSEKPVLKKARAYFKSGKYYWNSGIFLFQATTFLEELAKHSHDLFVESKQVVDGIKHFGDIIKLQTHLMQSGPFLPIDKIIFEKTKSAVVFPFKGGWHDLGNWNSLYDISKKDKDLNVKTENVVSFDTRESYLYSDKQLLVTAGISNLLVVVTKDVVFVTLRDEINNIKKMLHNLIEKKYTEATLSPSVYYDWGHCIIIEKTKDQQLKQFCIKPKHGFSCRIRKNHSVYWICLNGRASIQMGSKVISISKGKSIQLSHDSKLRIDNVGRQQFNFIEIYEQIWFKEGKILL